MTAHFGTPVQTHRHRHTDAYTHPQMDTDIDSCIQQIHTHRHMHTFPHIPLTCYVSCRCWMAVFTYVLMAT